MSFKRFAFILYALVVAFSGAAQFASASAQGGTPATRDPSDPKATVPPVHYESAFARYRPNAEAEVGAWRDTNDNVGRIGGWRIYGREAIEEPKAEKPPAASSRNEGGPVTKPDNGHAHRRAQ